MRAAVGADFSGARDRETGNSTPSTCRHPGTATPGRALARLATPGNRAWRLSLAVRHQTLAGRPETRRGSAELSGLPLSAVGLDDWPVHRPGAEGGQVVAVQGVNTQDNQQRYNDRRRQEDDNTENQPVMLVRLDHFPETTRPRRRRSSVVLVVWAVEGAAARNDFAGVVIHGSAVSAPASFTLVAAAPPDNAAQQYYSAFPQDRVF